MRVRDLQGCVVVLSIACATQKAAAPSSQGLAAREAASASEVRPALPDAAVDTAPELGMAHVPRDLPLGVSPVLYALSVHAASVPTPELAALGEKLFRDKRLSVDDSTSCATCHDPDKGFVDHKVTAEGVGHQRGERNSPTVINAMFNATQFWDGRAPTLEEQAKLPILNPIEMGQKAPTDVVTKLRAITEYAEAFQRVFGHEVTYDDLATAIAAFERTQYAGNAPFDHFIMGEENAIDASAKRGWALFNGKGRCNSCHAGNATSPLFSDQKFHNIGIAAHKQNFAELAREGIDLARSGEKRVDELAIGTRFSELGRFLVTRQTSDVGAFKTPNLRNVAVTAPYMHDGSLPTLWDVMDHYNKGGIPNPFLDGGMQRLGLTEPEIDDLVHLLVTLTSPKFADFARTEMAQQTTLKASKRPQRDVAAATGKTGDFGDLAPNPNLQTKSPANVGLFGTYDGKGAHDGH